MPIRPRRNGPQPLRFNCQTATLIIPPPLSRGGCLEPRQNEIVIVAALGIVFDRRVDHARGRFPGR